MGNEMTEIQFLGVAEITQSCINAVLRYMQFGDSISKVLILTCRQSHSIVLFIEEPEIIAIKSGFRSGYSGEGSKGFAYILSLLNEQRVEIEEYNVEKKIIEKINCSSLTEAELKKIVNSKPVRPKRWHDYIYAYEDLYSEKEDLLTRFPHVIPFSIIDPRLFDLSISFWDAPGDKILTGYKRLEDVIRKRCDLDNHGVKLFQNAFLDDKSVLFWPGLNAGETKGRANLFSATYQSFRNRRAHKEIKEDPKSQLMEFLSLNHLFVLESTSKLKK